MIYFYKTFALQMLVTIRTANSQRKVNVDKLDDLEMKIKEIFKTESFQLFSDLEKTIPMNINEVKENTTIFMSYEMGEIKTHQAEFKCTHSPDAVCPKCVNIDLADKAFTPGKKVKYFSYSSYLQALEDKSMKKEVYDYVIRKCEEHPANQRCSKCMDKQITLVQQPYRYIDYVEFDSVFHFENLINDFKSSGRQQIGLILGKICDNPDIPLGKKAVVSAIWKIEQETFPDGVIAKDLPQEFYSNELSILGVIYTDLIYKNGEFSSYKMANDYGISTLEIDFIASLAIKYKNKAFFGICLSANSDKKVEPTVYMVSEQYEALIKAGAIGLTTDPKMFITSRDIVYFINNEYNKKVSKKADPLFPVFYFIVTCEAGFNEKPLFEKMIAIKKHSASNIAKYFTKDYSFSNFKCFDVLCALKEFIPTLIKDLIDSVIKNDETLFQKVVEKQEFIDFKDSLSKFIIEKWNCRECTYLNEAYKSQCDICGVPK